MSKKLKAQSLTSAKVAERVRSSVGKKLPQGVDADGNTPKLWRDCTDFIIDEADDVTVEEQELVEIIGKNIKKLSKGDSLLQIKTKLDKEIKDKKKDRKPTPEEVNIDDPLKRQRK